MVEEAKAMTEPNGSGATDQYYLLLKDEPSGPYSSLQIQEMLLYGDLPPETQCAAPGMKDWVAVRKLALQPPPPLPQDSEPKPDPPTKNRLGEYPSGTWKRVRQCGLGVLYMGTGSILSFLLYNWEGIDSFKLFALMGCVFFFSLLPVSVLSFTWSVWKMFFKPDASRTPLTVLSAIYIIPLGILFLVSAITLTIIITSAIVGTALALWPLVIIGLLIAILKKKR